MSEPEVPAVVPESGAEEPADGGSPTEGSPPGGFVSPNRTLMIVLAYLWILALIPFLTEDRDEEVKWHARNGLTLTVAELIFWVGIYLLSAFSGFLGCLLMPLYLFVWLAVLGLHVACMVKGVGGERLVIPGISQYADRF